MTDYMPSIDDDLEGAGDSIIPSFLRNPVGILRRRWLWMLAALLLGTLATTAFVLYVKPRYVATATIQVTGQRIPENLVRSTIQEEPLARINAMLGTILSRRELAALIERHDLYPGLRESVPLEKIVQKTRNDISIDEKPSIGRQARKSSQFYTVSFEDGRPDVAAAVANDVARRITDESIRSRSREASMTTEFLRTVLKQAETALREQNQKVTDFKRRHRGELPSELTANISKMDRLQLRLQSLSLQIAEAETRLATLATATSAPTPGVAASPESQLEALEQQLARELATRTERHPDVMALRRKIAAYKEAAGPTAPEGPTTPPSRQSLVAAAQRTIETLKAQRAETEEQLRILDEQVAGTPAREETLNALEERESVLREDYLEFLRKVQDAELAQNLESAQQGERFSVVDPAAVPSRPNPRWVYAALGGLGSLALALGVGVLLELLDPVLVSVDQLESVGELPVLGSVSRI